MLSGVLDFVELHPVRRRRHIDERGILYTFYKGMQQIPGPAPIALLLSPLLRLPGAWLWGVDRRRRSGDGSSRLGDGRPRAA